MTMFSTAVLAMQRESVFSARYREGLKKDQYWDAFYEDSSNLLAKLPTIAAYIYRMKFKGDTPIASDPSLDWGGNFAHMMGVPKPYDDVSRMYFILHSDHESGNVSAHTVHLVASALSDAYYALSAGLNGLAGPLHGLANEEVLRWVQGFMAKLGGQEPTGEVIRAALLETLKTGVIPGYGHAARPTHATWRSASSASSTCRTTRSSRSSARSSRWRPRSSSSRARRRTRGRTSTRSRASSSSTTA
jgi:citrate synthase